MKKISEEEKNNIITDYITGKFSYFSLGKNYNRCPKVIKRLLLNNGYEEKIAYTYLTNKIKQDILSDYGTGVYKYSDLAKKYKYSLTTISILCNKNGYKSKANSALYRKYTLDETYFDIIDTEKKAYILGLLYADGNNFPKKNAVTLTLQENDKSILDEINKEINSNLPLYYRNPKIIIKNNKTYKHKGTYRLSINNANICNKLSKLGCIPNKTLILTFPTEDQVPSHLIHHFIRGYFDGDGCVYTSKSRNSVKGAINITSTNDFIVGLQNILINKLNFTKTKLSSYENNIIKRLSYGGNQQCIKFAEWLYKDATIYLERKYNKFQKIKELVHNGKN